VVLFAGTRDLPDDRTQIENHLETGDLRDISRFS
jgi:hypothetical protein